jgi:hypothetical protein
MDSYRTPTPSDRDAGLRRLRTLTLATALVGTAGLVGFGAVAAISNSGQQATQVLAADQTTTAASGIGGFQLPGLSSPQQQPVATSRRGHVTSGGS